ncbi:DUF6371 domain-containing protein [Mucilaginibacter sp. L3T2-6]|uniref:DUF6371 domain-containing protein n=1 Tax=Mucilaginibacter sp. L3T2-6 TaxID=3062491 RepID=UPI002676BCB8|nr:DUF6371 domain-containing protein [Mucilaginibacter sp. L3T2-6]MDO3641216.1 DUF6371 domain-containing protein [Mucilaginibacter sp. L3T2-6]MDV6213308.1 DUF6371 domain-containing protein [Mucilaginibacter sp. L3T2-6]
MHQHRYTLEPYKGKDTRYMCPACKHRRDTFTRYIDNDTGEHLGAHVGACDRQEKCGYHYKPHEYFKDNPGVWKPGKSNSIKMDSRPENFSTIPECIMQGTQRGYHKNNFTRFLARMFGPGEAIGLVEKYKIGSAKYWPGATVFWQIDVNGKVRTGKIMLYSSADCRRVKEPYNHIAWAHSLLSYEVKVNGTKSAITNNSILPAKDFRLRQCLFGEHLLPLEPYKIVAITESEKTAIIASAMYPNYIWLAAGSLDGLTNQKCQVLKHRTVRLYPDINGYAKWRSKAHELNHRIPSATFTVDGFLLRTATGADRLRGVDIADKWIDEKLMEWEIEKELGL